MGRISPLQFKRGIRSIFAPPFALLWFAFLEANIHHKSTEGKPTDCSHGNYAGVVFRCLNRHSRRFRRENSGFGRRFVHTTRGCVSPLSLLQFINNYRATCSYATRSRPKAIYTSRSPVVVVRYRSFGGMSLPNGAP